MAARESKWVATVKTDSTHPPEGLFTKSASTIARTLASKKVSPKGPVSGLRMLSYFINRGGKRLSADRRAELEKAKTLLSKRVRRRKIPGLGSGLKGRPGGRPQTGRSAHNSVRAFSTSSTSLPTGS